MSGLFLLSLLSSGQHVAANSPYVRLVADTYAQVVQVVDGETLRVQPVGSNQRALVRLAGINTEGCREAQDFMTGAVLGRIVYLTLSAANAPSDRFDDRWVPVYLTYNDVVFNRSLVQRGLAVVDPDYENHWMYSLLVSDLNRARAGRLGSWEDTGFRTQPLTRRWRGRPGGGWWGDDRVNINTATASQINRVLYGTSAGSAIVRNRPYRSVGDVRFAPGALSRDEFDYFWGAMKVSTNINTANEEELAQLFDINMSDARAIVRHRDRGSFTSIYQLRDAGLMSSSVFERNRPFMTTHDVDEIEGVRADTVNINTATASELQQAGLTSSQANTIINARGNGYTIKSIGEIQQLSGVNLTDRRLHEISFYLRTDFDDGWGWHHGSAGAFPNLININTATRDELRRVGFSEGQVNQLLSRQGRMNSGRDIPFNVAAFDHSITLFTNVNRATAEEWMSLSINMSWSMARVLEDEAFYHPFASFSELRDLFYYYDYGNVYHRIRRFLVLR